MANAGSNNVFVVDTGTGGILANISVGSAPVGISLMPATKPLQQQLVALISIVRNINANEGIVNRLDSKLQALSAALSSANGGNKNAACGALGAFLNSVLAQSGKQISVQESAALLVAAHQIQQTLACGAGTQ